MKAAAYTHHGCDLHTLFARWDTNSSGELEADELHAVVNRMLPGAVARDDVLRLIDLMDRDRNGGVDFGEFREFVLGHEKAEAAARREAAASAAREANQASQGTPTSSLVQQRKLERPDRRHAPRPPEGRCSTSPATVGAIQGVHEGRAFGISCMLY